MPTANGDRLEWGEDHLVPCTARSAWGARLIVTQDGTVDLPPDRQGAAGEDRPGFLQLLNEEYSWADLALTIIRLLQDDRMRTGVAEDFVLHATDRLEVHANTRGSSGYCYVTAWSNH